MKSFAFLTALTCAVSMLMPSEASSQALDVSPVKMTLAPGQTTTTLRVTNRGSTSSALQIRPYLWQQEGGEERLTATSDLLVSPPLMKVAAGQSQIVRIVLRRAPGSAESTYRLLLDQLPAASVGGGVNVLLRISMPLFAMPAAQTGASAQWSVHALPTGGSELRVANKGSKHVELTGLGLKVGSRIVPVEGGQHLYVLAGSERRLRAMQELPALKPGTPVGIVSMSGKSEDIATVLVQAD